MHYQYAASYAMEESIIALLSGLFSGIPSFLIGIAVYVFTALALYTIAKRRCISKPWLSWVPVVNVWVLGSLSDQYRYVVRGENKSKRKALLVLSIIGNTLALAFLSVVVWLVVRIIMVATAGQNVENMVVPLVSSAVLILPLLGVAIAQAIVQYMALYDVYTSCDPQNNVLFLVLSILLPVTQPIFLFVCRQKDLGMPPRRGTPVYNQPQQPQWQQAPQQPQWQAPQPQQPPQQSQQPWNGNNKNYL